MCCNFGKSSSVFRFSWLVWLNIYIGRLYCIHVCTKIDLNAGMRAFRNQLGSNCSKGRHRRNCDEFINNYRGWSLHNQYRTRLSWCRSLYYIYLRTLRRQLKLSYCFLTGSLFLRSECYFTLSDNNCFWSNRNWKLCCFRRIKSNKWSKLHIQRLSRKFSGLMWWKNFQFWIE